MFCRNQALQIKKDLVRSGLRPLPTGNTIPRLPASGQYGHLQDALQNYQRAIGFKNHTIPMSAIILGDDNKYWVVTIGKMESLLRAGYELAV